MLGHTPCHALSFHSDNHPFYYKQLLLPGENYRFSCSYPFTIDSYSKTIVSYSKTIAFLPLSGQISFSNTAHFCVKHALQWAEQEMVKLSILSSSKKMVKGQIEEHISKLKQNFKKTPCKLLQNVDVKACLSDLQSKYVFVLADKGPNNIKRYHIETLIKELELDNFSTPKGNSTYTSCQMSS